MHSSERALLSQIILDPKIAASLSIKAEHFDNSLYAQIFQHTQALIDLGIAPDMMTLRDRMPGIDHKILVDVCGAMPSSANWTYHQGKIATAWKRRSLSRMAKELLEIEDVEESIAKAEETLTSLSLGLGKRKIEKAGDLVCQYLADVEKRYDNRGRLSGLETGIPALDDRIQGLRPRLLYVIGGRPSQGKSALGLNMATHQALKMKKTVGFISLESSTNELMTRAVASGGNVRASKILSGWLDEADMSRVSDYCDGIYTSQFYIWDQPNASLSDVRSVARQMRRVKKVEILYLDYLQLIKVPGHKERRDAVAESSMALKELARELEIPIVVLAQLNRDSDNRRPSLGDFQWSSQIEQDADVAILLYHKMRDDPMEGMVIDESFLLIDKCRDGRRGSISVEFQGEHVRFIPKL